MCSCCAVTLQNTAPGLISAVDTECPLWVEMLHRLLTQKALVSVSCGRGEDNWMKFKAEGGNGSDVTTNLVFPPRLTVSQTADLLGFSQSFLEFAEKRNYAASVTTGYSQGLQKSL